MVYNNLMFLNKKRNMRTLGIHKYFECSFCQIRKFLTPSKLIDCDVAGSFLYYVKN